MLALDKRRYGSFPKAEFWNQLGNFLGDEWHSIKAEIKTTTEEFLTDQYSDEVPYQELLNRYELEKTKFVQMTRLFIQIRKRMDHWKCDIHQVFKRYGLQPLLG